MTRALGDSPKAQTLSALRPKATRPQRGNFVGKILCS
jgi:hypothetical protein